MFQHQSQSQYFNTSISISINIFQCFSISKISVLQRIQHHNSNFRQGTIITLYLNHIDSSTTMIIHIISCWSLSQRQFFLMFDSFIRMLKILVHTCFFRNHFRFIIYWALLHFNHHHIFLIIFKGNKLDY